MKYFDYLGLSLFIFICISSCKEKEIVIPVEDPELTFREHYEQSLAQDTIIHIEQKLHWLEQGRMALLDNNVIRIPYQEQSPILKDHTAYGLTVEATMGEVIDIRIEGEEEVLVDVWLKNVGWELLNYEQSFTRELHIPVDESGDYLIRIQSLLESQHPFTIQVFKSPQNQMPVVGADDEDAWSRFGDPRDAGKRKHEGVDIFKRRGTPIVAASDGVITVVKDEGLGGKQIWVKDARLPISHYYAHLHDLYGKEGQQISKGDTIGTVGNTGNARTTRPHLHYGMYMQGIGAIDPFPFFGSPKRFRRFRSYKDSLPDTWAGPLNYPLRAGPSSRAEVVFEGTIEAPLSVLGWTNHWWHLRLPDGRAGYLYSL